jgi:pimeloyl-ACP methyl ester carboxylesterase
VLLSRIPHAVLHVLPGTGHLSLLESSQELAQLIRDFADARAAGETNVTNGKTTATAS